MATNQRQVDAKGVTAMKRYFGRIALVAVIAAGFANWAYNMSVQAATADAIAKAIIIKPISIVQTMPIRLTPTPTRARMGATRI